MVVSHYFCWGHWINRGFAASRLRTAEVRHSATVLLRKSRRWLQWREDQRFSRGPWSRMPTATINGILKILYDFIWFYHMLSGFYGDDVGCCGDVMVIWGIVMVISCFLFVKQQCAMAMVQFDDCLFKSSSYVSLLDGTACEEYHRSKWLRYLHVYHEYTSILSQCFFFYNMCLYDYYHVTTIWNVHTVFCCPVHGWSSSCIYLSFRVVAVVLLAGGVVLLSCGS